MSETIVDMTPVVISKEALDAALAGKASAPIQQPEVQNEPVAEKRESFDTVDTTESTPNFTPGDTSENWAMKTESVEIPAEKLEEIKSIPLPSPFGEDEPVPVVEEPAPPFIVSPPPTPFTIEEPEVPLVAEAPAETEITAEAKTSDESDSLSDVPVPSIIQEPDFDPKNVKSAPEEAPKFTNFAAEGLEAETDETPVETQNPAEIEAPVSFEAQIPVPVTDSFEFPESRTQSPAFEEKPAPVSEGLNAPVDDLNKTLDPVEESGEKFDRLPTEIPQDTAESNFEKNSERFIEKPPEFFEKPTLVPNQLELDPEILNVSPVDESPNEEFVPAIAENLEPPIGMPDLPLVLENPEVASKFDSVQIFQKDEIEPEKEKAAEPEPKSVFDPDLVPESAVEAQPEQSSTTPIVAVNDTDGRKTAKLKPLDEGTILNGRYEIVRKIGGGGMGAVYLANDRNLGGVLRAVKEMVQSYIESEQQDKAIADFKRESLLLTSLDHTAIPTIYDYFFDEAENRFYLVMKYISGGDLASRLRAAPEGRLDEKTVTDWAIQIADVLHYLHNHEPSIVYRDLKPANVMIDGNSGRVMLIDFGIARWVNKEEKGVTAVGTMGYAPPELFSGNVEPRSDIYSLGSTIFHLLTGADPQSNPLLIFDFQKNPRPRQINSQLSDQIEQILMRAVEYNAEARFASAAEMREALKEHLINLQAGKVTYGVKVAPSNRAFSEQAVFCGFCGKQIVATDVFCAFCGAQQPIAQQGISSPSIAVQPMTAKLIIQATGEFELSTFRLEKNDNLLGRRDPMSNIFPEVDLSRFDPQTKISRRHARIWREGNSFLVEDLGSSNGTTLLPSTTDSVRLLPHQPHTLTNGDKIRLGDTTLHFTIG